MPDKLEDRALEVLVSKTAEEIYAFMAGKYTSIGMSSDESLCAILRSAITAALSSERVETLKKAARAVCKRQCDQTEDPVYDSTAEAWFHRGNEWPSVLCPSGPIHDLIQAANNPAKENNDG